MLLNCSDLEHASSDCDVSFDFREECLPLYVADIKHCLTALFCWIHGPLSEQQHLVCLPMCYTGLEACRSPTELQTPVQVILNVSESIALKLLKDCTIATRSLEGDTVAMLCSNMSGSLVDLAVRAACPSIDSDATLSVSVRNTRSAACVASILPRLQSLKTLEFQIVCVRHYQEEAAHSPRPRHCKEMLHTTRQLPLLVNLSVTISIPVASQLRSWRRRLASAISGLPYLQRLEVTMTPHPVFQSQACCSFASPGRKMLTRAIGQLSKLTHLKLIGSLLSTLTGPQAVRQLTSLQALHLRDKLQTLAPLSEMLHAAPTLTRLTLSEVQGQCDMSDERGPILITRNGMYCTCSGNPIASAIGTLAHLRLLQITADMPPRHLPLQCMMDPLPHPMTKCARLSSIELMQTTQCHSLPLLLHSFCRLRNLQHLRIEVHHVLYGRCKHTSPQCRQADPRIFEEVAMLRRLTSLRLSGFAMPQSHASVGWMASALGKLKKLRKLHMQLIWMGDSDDSRAATKALQLLRSSMGGQCAIEVICNSRSFSLTSRVEATSTA